MPQIMPIKDLKDTARISQICEESNEPIFITKNGYGNLVVMSMEVYRQFSPFNHIISKIEEGESAVAEGRTRDGFEMIEEKRARYGA
jgi:PHD/YefM family antitoxin component YafN of YafNO toxin-antitoxin module